MVASLRPTETADTILQIDYERLWRLGMRTLLFDLDNTLAKHGSLEIPKRVDELLTALRVRGFRIGIVTNRRSKETPTEAAWARVFPTVRRAGKPSRRSFRRLLERLGSSPDEAVMIGDRFVTDVLGGNRLGLHTIRVRRPTSSDGRHRSRTRGSSRA